MLVFAPICDRMEFRGGVRKKRVGLIWVGGAQHGLFWDILGGCKKKIID